MSISAPLFGVDVSYSQTAIDWPAAVAGGITFAIIRATYGTRVDSRWQAHRHAASQADGLVMGAYHCLSPAAVVSPADQADAFLDAVGDTDGYLLMVDVETVCAGNGPDLRAFARRVAEHRPEHPLLVYAPAWYWPRIGNPDTASIGPLVQSHYVDVVDPRASYPYRLLYRRVPASWWTVAHGGWRQATFLQYTSSGAIPGYGKRVDVDAFDGTRLELEALTRDTPEDPMKLTDAIALTGRATMTTTWRLWAVDTDTATAPAPAGSAFDVLGSVRYHPNAEHPDGFLGYLVRFGPAGALHVLPSEGVSTFVALPADPAVLTATRQAEYDRVLAGARTTTSWPPRP